MLDETTPKGRIISAALALAAKRPWSDVTMRDIADAAGTDLSGLRREFGAKSAILAAFMRSVDDAVLARAPAFGDSQSARDRIFDVVMSRLDVLQPYKPALISIAASQPFDTELARRAMASSAWMLHAAGINTDGATGFPRVAGLAAIYRSVLETWLEDDDPGMGRTMAALDRRLKRGEEAVRTLSQVATGAEGLVQAMRDGLRSFTSGAAQPSRSSSTAAPSSDGPP